VAIRAIGHAAGKRVTCVLTDMNAPIGRAIGNALEIRESIDTLAGGGPADTRELTVVLGGEMLVLGGVASSADDGRARIARALDDGSALALFRAVVAAQGGDPRVCDAPDDVLPRATETQPLPAPRAGVVAAIDAERIGLAALLLGAGRRTKEDAVDPAAGIVLGAQVGDHVDAGQPLAVFHRGALVAADPGRLAHATELATGAFAIRDAGEAVAPPHTRILEVLR